MNSPGRTDALLIVEDNPDDLHFLLRALRRIGSTVPVRVARDGEAALDYLRGAARAEDRLLAVLLDLKLPGRSGFEVLEEIKRDPALRTTPVVILTSSAESRDLQRAYDLGANSYLVKPTRIDGLIDLVTFIEAYWTRHNQVI